ncbi:MAG: metallophosphoesterase [Halanaeroarchaeum sp.]
MSIADLHLLDRAVYVPATETLVVSDLHLGKGADSSIELPVGEREDVLERLDDHLHRVAPETVVLAGDVLHSFERIPTGAAESLDAVIETIRDREATPVVLEGNHDTMLSTILGGPVRATYVVSDDTVAAHGHALPAKSASRYVVGHEHPAIRIEGKRHPCALDCRDQHDGAAVVVLPAFTRFARGTLVNDLDAADSLSPLVTDLESCRPIVYREKEPLEFPPLGEFRSFL